MGQSKSWLKSKIIWAGIADAGLGAVDLLSAFADKGDFSEMGFTHLVLGIMTVVFRVMSKHVIR